MDDKGNKSWEKLLKIVASWNPRILRKIRETRRQHSQTIKFYTFFIFAGIGYTQWIQLPILGTSWFDCLYGRPDQLQIAPRLKNKPVVLGRLMEIARICLESGRKSLSLENIACGHLRCKLRGTHRESYKDLTIKGYENRLRQFSRPEKIFSYFATIQTPNEADEWEIYMTPIDFIRSIMPGLRQPTGLGLNSYRKISKEKAANLSFKIVSRDSIFYKLHPNGLLSFGDYLYLRMFMQIPERYFQIGFNLLRDKQDELKVSKESMSHFLRNVVEDKRFKLRSSVNKYLFGRSGKKSVSFEKLLDFKQKLNHDVLLIEFNLLHRMDADHNGRPLPDNIISALSFASMILTYSCQSTTEKMMNLGRIKEKYKQRGSFPGITREEFMAFHKFQQNLNMIDSALHYHYISGANISRSTLRHLSKLVLGEPLSPHIIDIIYTVFDNNNDGILRRDELIDVMRHAVSHHHKKRWNMTKLFDSIWKCAQATL